MRIHLNEEKLHYDIFELVRTFIPGEEISFSKEHSLNLKIDYKGKNVSLYKEDKKLEGTVPYYKGR